MDFNPLDRNEQDFRLPPARVSFLSNAKSYLVSVLSTPSKVRGVDLSHWNGEVDFVALKNSGIDFVILKATEGTGWVDEKFNDYWQSAYNVGLSIMTYHFFRSQYGGSQQATHHRDTLINSGFLGTVNYKSPVMWADVETSDGATVSQRQNRLLAFHQTITGMKYQSGHYSSPYLWNSLIGNVSWAADYAGWDAHWTSASEPVLPAGWTRASTRVWQYGIYPTHSWVAPVYGTPGAVDCNWFYGTLQELNEWLGVTIPPSDCCDEMKAEIARLEAEINAIKLEVYNLQQYNISQDENIKALQAQGNVTNQRLAEIESLIQSVKNVLCN